MSAGGPAAPEVGPGPGAVALGGGHGLAATLSALRLLTDDVTAVVTVADDGGSSGRIRQELGLLPLGDLRMALGALAGQDEAASHAPVWKQAFEHRYGGHGALAGHAVGNLVLAGLLETLADPVAALDEAARLLGVRGRVLPMSPHPIDIEADVTGLHSSDAFGGDVSHRIRGQVAVASTPGRVQQIQLIPRRPPACDEAVAAIRSADVVTLGPGSWFSSVLPHLLVPKLLDALIETEARKVLVLNLAPQPGETAGFSPEQHLDVFGEHAVSDGTRLRLDVVLADRTAVGEPDLLRRGAEAFGADLHLAAVARADGTPRHEPAALADALAATVGRGARRLPDPQDPAPTAVGGPNGRARPYPFDQAEEDHQWP